MRAIRLACEMIHPGALHPVDHDALADVALFLHETNTKITQSGACLRTVAILLLDALLRQSPGLPSSRDQVVRLRMPITDPLGAGYRRLKAVCESGLRASNPGVFADPVTECLTTSWLALGRGTLEPLNGWRSCRQER